MLWKALVRPTAGSLLLTVPLVRAFVSPTTVYCSPRSETFVRWFSSSSSSSSESTSSAVSSLPSLLDEQGQAVSVEQCKERFQGKHIAYYFSAGWCPACLSFDPGLLQFRKAAQSSGKDIELIYVPSDRSEEAALQRSQHLKMMCVPFGKEADKIKKAFDVWAGPESAKLGFGRRSGVPAIVVLDGKTGKELAFLPAEAQGVAALQAWPLDEENSVW